MPKKVKISGSGSDTGPFADLQTVEVLATQLGGDVDRARRLLEEAGISVVAGVFSRTALLRCLGANDELEQPMSASSRAPVIVEPSLERIVKRLFDVVGIEGFDFLRRRGLVAKIRPRRSDQFLAYSAVAIDVRNDLEAHDSEETGITDVPSFFADEDIEIAAESARTIRVFTTKQTHSGVAYFTVATARTLDADFAVFVELSHERAWMVPTEWMVNFLDHGAELSHAHIHKASGALRFSFPRRRSSFDLDNRILRTTKQSEADQKST